MSDVFISYARETEARALQVAEALRTLGYGVWRDDEIPAHRAFGDVIEEQLRAARAVVVLWSAQAARSEWVRSEAERGRIERKLIQITLDRTELPMPFEQIQCADLSDWTGDAEAPAWLKVVASLAALTGRAGPPTGGATQRRLRRDRPSICVLPFVNMSGDPEQDYFSDGISEDIITDHSKVSALSVASRNTAFSYKGRRINVAEVARALSVSHVLEGSVRRAGGRVRITGQLIEGSSDSHVWAERYDRDLNDIFALQDEISEAIVTALKLKLLPQEKTAIARRGTTSVEAYDLYLMARQYLETGNQGDPRRDEAIARLCRRATEIDAGYARAWALMGHAQSTLALVHGRAHEDGLTAAERALALDPDLAEAHSVRARVLQAQARHDEAFAEIELALGLDPQSMEVNIRAANMYLGARRFAQAIGRYSKVAELAEGNFSATGMQIGAYEALGDADGVRRAAQMTLERVEKVIARDPGNGAAMGFGVTALMALGETERAKTWIARALLIDPENLPMRYNFACALARGRDADAAMELLAPVFATCSAWLPNLARSDPSLDPIRDDPRLAAMLADAEARLADGGDAATRAAS